MNLAFFIQSLKPGNKKVSGKKIFKAEPVLYPVYFRKYHKKGTVRYWREPVNAS